MVKGILVGGDFSDLLVRQRGDQRFELGELLVAEDDHQLVLLQVFDLVYGSQVSSAHLELMGGLALEESTPPVFFDPSLRNYTMAHCKALVSVRKMPMTGTATGSAIAASSTSSATSAKSSGSSGTRYLVGKAKGLPAFFSTVREPTPQDLAFLQKPEHPLFLGKLRSGSRVLDVPLSIDGRDAFSHHVLIAATTGRGKSNLLKCLLWDLVRESYCGALVLDPHDEYYRGVLDRHPDRSRIHHYSVTPQPGGQTLRFNVQLLRPQHFGGVIDWTDAQRQAIAQYYKEFNSSWIEAIVRDKQPQHGKFLEGTIAVVRRRIGQVLGLDIVDDQVTSDGLFVLSGGMTTVGDICSTLQRGDTVVVDTSAFDGAVEILVGSIIATELLRRHKRANLDGTLTQLPVVSIILEEAPRVLGKEVLEQGANIFSTIAREGRKFKIGLTAITQLPSLIPHEVLANMNTKIILGIEMKPERQSLIESASQDLTTDDRAIASLDKGEAIITSTFVPFALPVGIPRFEEFSANDKANGAAGSASRGSVSSAALVTNAFGGVKLR